MRPLPNRTTRPRPEPSNPALHGVPVLTVANRQRGVCIDLRRLREYLNHALPLCLVAPGADAPVLLRELSEVSVTVVSPDVMSRVHHEFLQIEGPTDVITFPYGEIVICAAVAHENAERYSTDVQDEVLLYAIHGLLHLHGYDDIVPESARRMRTMQVNILNAVRICA